MLIFNGLKKQTRIKIILYIYNVHSSTNILKKVKIQLKSKDEIEKLRYACQLAAEVLNMITEHVKSGVSTKYLDDLCFQHITEVQKAVPANIGYRGYQKTICASVNQVICHGIPSDEKILKDGDIMNIDVTVKKDGWHGDTSKMFLIGKPEPHNQRLVKVTQECLYLGINEVRPGARLGNIGSAIQSHAENNHYSVVEDYCGHGIGQIYHDEPQILHFGRRDSGLQMKPGLCFTIEPMINQGDKRTKVLNDGWTVVTKDGRNSAQWEHTVAVTEDGYDVLTKRYEEALD